MVRSPSWKLTCFTVVVLALAGCSSTPPPLVPASGTLRRADGKSLAGAGINFWPQDDPKGFWDRYKVDPHSVTNDPKGAFEMALVNDRNGVPAGRYKVTAAMLHPAKAHLIPERYHHPDHTPWVVTIPKEGKTDILLVVE